MQNLLPFYSVYRPIFQSLRFASRRVKTQTYYEILNLPQDCTAKDIRNAFVTLSKKFHPDVKGAKADRKHSAQFVEISEAYQVLSKPKLRSAYDQDLKYRGRSHGGAYAHTAARHHGNEKAEYHRPWEVHPNYDPNPNSYYGVKGVERMSNRKIVSAIVTIGIISAIIGFSSAKHSFTFNRQQLDNKSIEASLHHSNVRADAEKFGNEEQLRRMLDRIAKSALER